MKTEALAAAEASAALLGPAAEEGFVGRLVYDALNEVELDDRTLAHLQIVIGAKLRRGESFYFSWYEEAPTGGGRTTIWLHPAIPLSFRYSQPDMPQVNPAWIQRLSDSANTTNGLRLLPEPGAAAG